MAAANPNPDIQAAANQDDGVRASDREHMHAAMHAAAGHQGDQDMLSQGAESLLRRDAEQRADAERQDLVDWLGKAQIKPTTATGDKLVQWARDTARRMRKLGVPASIQSRLLSLATEGAASTIMDRAEEMVGGDGAPIDEFINAIAQVTGDGVHPVVAAQVALASVTQGAGTVQQYNGVFNAKVAALDQVAKDEYGCLKPDDAGLILLYLANLRPGSQLRRRLERGNDVTGAPFKTVQELQRRAGVLESQVPAGHGGTGDHDGDVGNSRKRPASGEAGVRNGKRRDGAAQRSPSEVADARARACRKYKLSSAQLDFCSRNQLCLNCKDKGHRAYNCKLPSNSMPLSKEHAEAWKRLPRE